MNFIINIIYNFFNVIFYFNLAIEIKIALIIKIVRIININIIIMIINDFFVKIVIIRIKIIINI